MSSLLPYWVPLEGAGVHVRPLEVDDAPLLERVARQRDTYGFTVVPNGPDEAAEYVARLLDEASEGVCAPYVVVVGGDVAGATRLMSPRWFSDRPAPDVVEIGGTWLAEAHQGTGLNRRVKGVLLRHCFEGIGVGRVEFKTDARNERSRRALTRLGAREEGVLRQAHPSLVRGEEGQARDSVMFSILPEEWARLAPHLR